MQKKAGHVSLCTPGPIRPRWQSVDRGPFPAAPLGVLIRETQRKIVTQSLVAWKSQEWRDCLTRWKALLGTFAEWMGQWRWQWLKVTTTGRKCIKTFSSSVCVWVYMSECMNCWSCLSCRWAFCMTDGPVTPEDVVSINNVPIHTSTTTDSNMCTFLSVTLYTYHTYTYIHTRTHAQTALHAHTPTYSTVFTQEHPHRHESLHKARCSTHTFTSPAHSYCIALLCSTLLLRYGYLCGKIHQWEINLVQQSMKVLSFPNATCSYGFSSEGLVHLCSTGSHVKINSMQVVCGFSWSFGLSS